MEIGRIDILLEVSLLSTHLSLPREGHMEQVLQIFGYLKIHKKIRLLFDCSYPRISYKLFKEYDWFYFYRYAKRLFLLIFLNQGYMKSPFLCLLMLTLQGEIPPGASRQGN